VDLGVDILPLIVLEIVVEIQEQIIVVLPEFGFPGGNGV